jgi:hypothetical protein
MPAPQTVARDARDMRERRDMDRLGSHLVSPGPPVSYDYAVGVVSCCVTYADHRSSSVPT